MASRLQTFYRETVVPALQSELGYRNIMQVPKVAKVVLNVGFGRHAKEEKYIESVEKTLKAISGQKPMRNKSKKSISNFKIREGMVIGASVTLRGERMYDFLDRLITLTLPRVRDFRGLETKSFDKQGNYTFGFKEHLAFPEIAGVEATDIVHGIEITVSTSAASRDEGFALLKKLGFPFKKTK
ncbi:MAG: 50S ribosomal protein L5 [Patescibacteria group bacterium]